MNLCLAIINLFLSSGKNQIRLTFYNYYLCLQKKKKKHFEHVSVSDHFSVFNFIIYLESGIPWDVGKRSFVSYSSLIIIIISRELDVGVLDL